MRWYCSLCKQTYTATYRTRHNRAAHAVINGDDRKPKHAPATKEEYRVFLVIFLHVINTIRSPNDLPS